MGKWKKLHTLLIKLKTKIVYCILSLLRVLLRYIVFVITKENENIHGHINVIFRCYLSSRALQTCQVEFNPFPTSALLFVRDIPPLLRNGEVRSSSD